MIYEHSHYRKALRDLVTRARALDGKFTQGRLASAIGIQGSYLSSALAGRVDLSADQLFLIARHFRLDDAETDFFLLLLERDRCQVPERKRALDAKVKAVRAEHLRTQAHLDASPVPPDDLSLTEYYLEPHMTVVHVFLGIPKYAGDVGRIAAALGIGNDKLQHILDVLERLGYAQRRPDGRYGLGKSHRHLPASSPLCLPHQLLMRTKSAERMQRQLPQKRYTFSVTLSTSAEVRDRLHAEFLAYLRRAEALTNAVSRPDRVYQMNFDLFPWDE